MLGGDEAPEGSRPYQDPSLDSWCTYSSRWLGGSGCGISRLFDDSGALYVYSDILRPFRDDVWLSWTYARGGYRKMLFGCDTRRVHSTSIEVASHTLKYQGFNRLQN